MKKKILGFIGKKAAGWANDFVEKKVKGKDDKKKPIDAEIVDEPEKTGPAAFIGKVTQVSIDTAIKYPAATGFVAGMLTKRFRVAATVCMVAQTAAPIVKELAPAGKILGKAACDKASDGVRYIKNKFKRNGPQ